MAEEQKELIKDIGMPLFQARGWMKFLGILLIIQGVLTALSIVGILVAWLPIWAGVLLYQAASAVESAGLQGDRESFLRSLGKLRTFFVLMGIVALVVLVLALLGLLFGMAGMVGMMGAMGPGWRY